MKLTANARTNLIVDVFAYSTAAIAPVSTTGLYVPVTPARVMDSRINFGASGIFAAGQTSALTIGGVTPGVPNNAAAILSTITSDQTVADGYITAWAGVSIASKPNVSNLNPIPGAAVANSAYIPLELQAASFYSHTSSHLITDVAGYFAA
jgi:hypothetical protein